MAPVKNNDKRLVLALRAIYYSQINEKNWYCQFVGNAMLV